MLRATTIVAIEPTSVSATARLRPAAAVTGCLSSALGVAFGTPLGRVYDGTVSPIIGGFVLRVLFGLLAIAVVVYLLRRLLGGRF